MTTGILIIHTPWQLEEASSLVDLLEASLSLPAGAIVCSSLPGYAWPSRGAVGVEHPLRFAAALDTVGAAIALVDAPAMRDPQLWFDVAAAWARGKRIALLTEGHERPEQFPPQLGRADVIARMDRTALCGLIEDLAFDLGLSPRLGPDAQRALAVLSSAPPPAAAEGRTNGAPTERTHSTGADVAEAQEAVRTAPVVVSGQPFGNDEVTANDELELIEAALEPLSEPELVAAGSEPLREPEPVSRTNGVSCELSLEAGRAISECAFHRDEGGPPSAELEQSFGRFIDAVGGNWDELKRLGDVDLWLGATDNLLESLPPEKKHLSEWYEVGFQFSTLQAIAEQGLPSDPEQRAVYQELWNQSMAAFHASAESAHIVAREARRVQALLENLIGPEPQRDYTNVARSLQELRSLAGEADRL